MSEDPQRGSQQGIAGPAPGLAARMQAESRDWLIRCTYCGYERSVWDSGGVRYKAVGTARRLLRCPQCGRLSWHLVYRRDSPQAAAIAARPPAAPGRRAALWALGIVGLALVAALFLGGLWLGLNATLQPVVGQGDAFLTALQRGQDAAAYALCAPDLQQQLGGVGGLTGLAQGHRPGHWSWSSRSVRNGVGRLDGSLTYADGAPGAVHLQLQQVGGAWRIESFRLTSG